MSGKILLVERRPSRLRSRFSLKTTDGCRPVWRRSGERYTPCVSRADHLSGGAIMMLADITMYYRTPLVVTAGNLIARRYNDETFYFFFSSTQTSTSLTG